MENKYSLSWPAQAQLSRPLTRPYYRWLQKCIISFIESMHWKSGQRIPNELDISHFTGLNINTVKKALLAQGKPVERQSLPGRLPGKKRYGVALPPCFEAGQNSRGDGL